MSSPRINNTIIVGGLLIYVAVVFMCIDYAGSMPRMNNHICMVRSTSIQKILNKNRMAMFVYMEEVFEIYLEFRIRCQ